MDVEVQSSENEVFTNENDNLEFQKQNAALEEKLINLKEVMNSLKEQLNAEREAWEREVETANKIVDAVQNICICEHDSCKAVSDTNIETIFEEPTLTETSILDYEHKLAVYQDALQKAHLEKRNLIKRQLAVNAYKNRLLEVESMCNMELQKVKQSFECLQPLQALAQEWESPAIENMSNFDEEITGQLKTNGIESKEFFTVEALGNKLYNDFKEIASQISPLSSHATCTTLCLEDEELMAKRLQSMNWYNNEIGHSAFNPLM